MSFNIIRNNLQELILSLTLLLPIFNFFLLFDLSTKQLELKNHQEDLHLFILIAFLTIISYFFISPGEGIVNVLLSIISSISTSGITTYTPSDDLSLLLILLTIVGGSLISTSSGIKYVRFYILLKISYQEIHKIAKPMNIFNKNLFIHINNCKICIKTCFNKTLILYSKNFNWIFTNKIN